MVYGVDDKITPIPAIKDRRIKDVFVKRVMKGVIGKDNIVRLKDVKVFVKVYTKNGEACTNEILNIKVRG